MTTDIFKEVSEDDYKKLEDTFRTMLVSSDAFVLEHPELREDLDNFIIEVGNITKGLLQKYGKQDFIKGLEVEDYQKKYMDIKRKNVRMNLKMKQIEGAVNAFNNVK